MMKVIELPAARNTYVGCEELHDLEDYDVMSVGGPVVFDFLDEMGLDQLEEEE